MTRFVVPPSKPSLSQTAAPRCSLWQPPCVRATSSSSRASRFRRPSRDGSSSPAASSASASSALFTLGFHFAFDKALENTPNPEARLSLGIAFATLTLFGVYVVNYLASFLALFLSVGAVSGEIDSGTLHAVLARPITRSEFIVGRWLGYVVMLGVYIVAMTSAVLLIARPIAGYEVPEPLPALLLMLLEGALLLTLSLFGSTVMPTLANGVVVFTLLGLAWLGGIIEFVGRLLHARPRRDRRRSPCSTSAPP